MSKPAPESRLTRFVLAPALAVVNLAVIWVLATRLFAHSGISIVSFEYPQGRDVAEIVRLAAQPNLTERLAGKLDLIATDDNGVSYDTRLLDRLPDGSIRVAIMSGYGSKPGRARLDVKDEASKLGWVDLPALPSPRPLMPVNLPLSSDLRAWISPTIAPSRRGQFADLLVQVRTPASLAGDSVLRLMKTTYFAPERPALGFQLHYPVTPPPAGQADARNSQNPFGNLALWSFLVPNPRTCLSAEFQYVAYRRSSQTRYVRLQKVKLREVQTTPILTLSQSYVERIDPTASVSWLPWQPRLQNGSDVRILVPTALPGSVAAAPTAISPLVMGMTVPAQVMRPDGSGVSYRVQLTSPDPRTLIDQIRAAKRRKDLTIPELTFEIQRFQTDKRFSQVYDVPVDVQSSPARPG